MVKGILPPNILEALRRFDSPTVSNAIELFKVRNPTEGYASMELRCWFPELPPMVGYAVTCSADSTSPEPVGPNRLTDLLEAVAAAPRPAVVVIQHKAPNRMRSCLVGDILCTSLRKLGAVGIVTDGGVRDIRGIRQRASDFQLFAPGSVVSHGTATFLEVGIPVSISGLLVYPGDLLHGDESGLLKVPLDIAELVVEQAGSIRENESKLFDFLKSDVFSLQELKLRLVH